jgi:UDP-N-acetylglucosamine--N-acetylmuramyl-(pentapeptide) pyrophosphoryl-undecaprenol N-acetylglucosamine transferase
MALSTRNAAILVKDAEAAESLVNKITELAADPAEQLRLSANISALAIRNSAQQIAEYAFMLAGKSKK